MRYRPSRWFLRWAAGLLIFLGLSVLLAGLLLLRQGFVLREGLVSGNSMEPHLRGPRMAWRCSHCSAQIAFGIESVRVGRGMTCPSCEQVTDANDIETLTESSLGETIQYAPLRMMRSQRATAIQNGQAESTGIVRGDMVVLRDSLKIAKEIKRVVGFPGEHIRIAAGDLWVDHERFQKSLAQAVRQAVLVDVWEKARGENAMRLGAWTCNGDEWTGPMLTESEIGFTMKHGQYIDNRLYLNAHDKHRIVAARDIGLAIQCTSLPNRGTLRCKLATPTLTRSVSLAFDIESMVIKTERNSKTILRDDLKTVDDRQLNNWLIVCNMDQNLIIGDSKSEWFREPNSPSIGSFVEDEAVPSRAVDNAILNAVQYRQGGHCPVALQIEGTTMELQSLLVFRDIEYRGANDSSEQAWEVANGLVVLGDNVSISRDSRDRWPMRLRSNAIKGVVVGSANPVEDLLRQRW